MTKRRVVVISDTHCGHRKGLTPERWHRSEGGLRPFQEETWNWFRGVIASLQPIDVLLINGDGIDGNGHKSGGTEQLTTDREEQAEMLLEIIRECKPRVLKMTYGTGVHTGDAEDWERVAMRRYEGENTGCHCSIDDISMFRVEGVGFNARHHNSRSGVPHGRATPLLKEVLWNLINSAEGTEERADVMIRSHVHYLQYAGDEHSLAISTPALQGGGSKYGARRCTGKISFGFLHFDCEDGGYTWQAHILVPKAERRQTKPLDEYLGKTSSSNKNGMKKFQRGGQLSRR